MILKSRGFSDQSVSKVGQILDFTRCVRSNGTAYGTSGKCRKGVEQSKKPRPEGEEDKQKEEERLFSYLVNKRYGDQPERKEKALRRYGLNSKLANKLRDVDDGKTEILAAYAGVSMTRRLNDFDEVSLDFDGRTVSFKANGEFDYGTIEDRKDRVKAVLEVRKMFQGLVKELLPGTVIDAIAYDEDGRENQRRKAYEKIGFVSMTDGTLMAKVSESGSLELSPTFSENIGSIADWYQVLFGTNPKEDFTESCFDFTRCVRPDGTAYGTGGKCRKGTEREKPYKAAVTQGRFNIPHKGHVKLIQEMLRQAPVAHIVMGKGEENVNKDFRAQMLRAMLRKEGVDLSRVKILRGGTISKVTKGLSEGNDSKGVVLVLGEDQGKFLNSMGRSQGIGTVAVPRTSEGASSSAIRKMIDSGNEKSLEKEYEGDKYLIRLAKVARKIEKNEFSEFDFARCMRPNGTYYGTAGKCRKGSEVGAKEKAKVEKAAKKAPKSKLYGPDGKADIVEVEKKAEEWRKKSGLDAFPGTYDWSHDRVHALVHDFLGGDDKIGKWIGSGPKSPTPAEETLVNMVHRAAALKAKGEDYAFSNKDIAMYVTRDLMVTYGRNQIPDNMLSRYFIDDEDKISRIHYEPFIEKFREMQKSPGYERLLDGAHAMWTNAGKVML